MKHAASCTHRRTGSLSSIGSWISESSTTVATNHPSPVLHHFSSLPDICILGRTSPEIHELCARPNLLCSTFQHLESCSNTASSIPTMSTRGVASWSNVSSSDTSEAIRTAPEGEEETKALLDDVASTFNSLRLNTTGRAHTHVDLRRRLKAPAKRFSPTKTQRRISFEGVPLPQDFISTGTTRPRRSHRRNTTQIIMHD